MKYFLLLFILFPILTFSQVPEKFTYQSVIRDSNGELVTNQNIGIKFTITKIYNNDNGSYSYTIYSETHNTTSNENGLVTLEIGTGEVIPAQAGSFSDINWGTGDQHFLQSEIDITGSTNYTISTTTELLSVPYALYAENTKSLIEDYTYIWQDNTTVNLEAGKRYAVTANNVSFILPQYLYMDKTIEIHMMQHTNNPRNVTILSGETEDGVYFMFMNSNNEETYIGDWSSANSNQVSGQFVSGVNKIIPIDGGWMSGSFTPDE